METESQRGPGPGPPAFSVRPLGFIPVITGVTRAPLFCCVVSHGEGVPRPTCPLSSRAWVALSVGVGTRQSRWEDPENAHTAPLCQESGGWSPREGLV